MKKFLKKAKRVFIGLLIGAASVIGLDFGARRVFQERVPLSQNYIDAVAPVFGNTIDYSKVRIVFGKVSCLQPGKAVTIGNTIYYPPPETPAPDQSFTHEMTHVWQQQNNVPGTGFSGVVGLFMQYPLSYKDAYKFTADSTKALTDYNLEQQACIVAEYSILKKAMDSDPKHPPNARYETLKAIVKKTIPVPPQK